MSLIRKVAMSTVSGNDSEASGPTSNWRPISRKSSILMSRPSDAKTSNRFHIETIPVQAVSRLSNSFSARCNASGDKTGSPRPCLEDLFNRTSDVARSNTALAFCKPISGSSKYCFRTVGLPKNESSSSTGARYSPHFG